MRLPRGEHKTQRPSGAVGHDTGFGAIAAARTTQRLAVVTLGRGGTLFQRSRRFVMGPDVAAVDEDDPRLHAAACRALVQQPRPHPEAAPTDEGLGGAPPRTEIGRALAPFGAVVVPPDDGLEGATQVDVVGLVSTTAGLDQRSQSRPLRIGENPIRGSVSYDQETGRNSGANRA